MFAFVALLILIVAIKDASCYSTGLNLNGTWQLDKSGSQSPDEILRLIGTGSYVRRIINNLEITETYLISRRSVKITKVTSYRPEAEEEVYFYGVNETKDDFILGTGTQTTYYNSGNLYYTFIRRDHTSIYTSVKELIDNKSRMRVTSNFAIPALAKSATCIRYFVRKQQ